MPQRFRPSGRDSFWGDAYLELAVAKDHFLRRLNDLIDWEDLTQDLADCYKGGAEHGPIPYHPVVLFKMLLISYQYKMSERQTEEYVMDSMSARLFLGLAAHQSAPDHSSLSVFQDRILAKKGPEAFTNLFEQVVRIAREKGADTSGGCHSQRSGCRCNERQRAPGWRGQATRWGCGLGEQGSFP